jgi:FAD/FMN-containing dehydrogenase
MSSMMPDREKVIAGLSALIGTSHVITDDAMMAPYLTDWRKRYTGRAMCVARPASTDDVIAVMRFAKEHHCAVVPQGGNTGLVGGSVPLGRGDEILLSFQRMTHIRSLGRRSGAAFSFVARIGGHGNGRWYNCDQCRWHCRARLRNNARSCPRS